MGGIKTFWAEQENIYNFISKITENSMNLASYHDIFNVVDRRIVINMDAHGHNFHFSVLSSKITSAHFVSF